MADQAPPPEKKPKPKKKAKKPRKLYVKATGAAGRGRPSDFKGEYSQMLIDHMKKGGSIESFGAKVHCAVSTLYEWFKEYPEFSEAKKIAISYLHEFWENLGKTMATGQLRRTSKETPMLDSLGQPIYDKEGRPLMTREYEYAGTASPSVWIFSAKNMMKWRDRHDLEVSGKDGGPVNFSSLSDKELKEKIANLVKKAKE